MFYLPVVKVKCCIGKLKVGKAVKELAYQSESIFNIAALDSAEHFIFSVLCPRLK